MNRFWSTLLPGFLLFGLMLVVWVRTAPEPRPSCVRLHAADGRVVQQWEAEGMPIRDNAGWSFMSGGERVAARGTLTAQSHPCTEAE